MQGNRTTITLGDFPHIFGVDHKLLFIVLAMNSAKHLLHGLDDIDCSAGDGDVIGVFHGDGVGLVEVVSSQDTGSSVQNDPVRHLRVACSIIDAQDEGFDTALSRLEQRLDS